MSRVLIVKFGAIGDVIMALPAVHALYLKGAEIEWVCGSAVAPLLACYPWIRLIVADDRAILQGTPGQRLGALIKLWRMIGRCKYDHCVTLYYDTRYKFLTLPVRARRKVMLSWIERERRLLPTRSHYDEYARILLNEKDTYRPESVVPIRPEHLPPCPLPKRERAVRIGIAPGGASNMLRQQTLRRWPVAGYAELTRELLGRGYEVVLLGGQDDAWVRSEFQGLEVIDAIGRLSLPEVVSACDTCDVVVSHDTGPMHLAGLSYALLVGLFGPTDPGSFLPRREGVRGIWGGEGFACRPCYDGRNFAPCLDNGCMQQITTSMVIRQIDALLAERESGKMRSQLVVLPSSVEPL
jgi:heptosyltransferase II